ncbi:MAG: hypothetical protein PHC61_17580, partial [Chitinivibrionales bacterium]|nr:hypothetical protein [Chitinivibrionales bacterium]
MQQAPTSLRDIDFNYYIRRYGNLFWRWKWYIIISGPLVTAAWIIYIFKFGSIQPALDATAFIGIENTSDMTGVKDISVIRDIREPAQEKADLLKSRNFLGSVVDKLSLRLVVAKEFRKTVFDSLYVDSTAAMGRYEFRVDKNKENYTFNYWNRQFGKDAKIIRTGRLVVLDTVTLPGMYLKFSNDFLKNAHDVKFF